MARLIARSPCAGLLPLTIGGLILTEVDPGPVTAISPFKGRWDAVSAALQAGIGIGLPGPGMTIADGDVRAIWAGIGRVLVMGAPVPASLTGDAALTDQSDAQAIVRVEGAGVEMMLARLVPIDLRLPAFGVGATARTLIGHMTGSVTRPAPAAFELAVMRSMAETLVADLTHAARGHAARATAGR